MNFITRWKARRQLKKTAKFLERFASEMPASSIKILFPGKDTVDARNALLNAARRIRNI